MARSLIEILKLGNTGHYSIIEKLNHEDSKEMLEIYRKQLEKQLSNSSNARWDLALTIARLVRSGAWIAFHDQTHELYDKYYKEHPGCKCSSNPYYPVGGNWWAENSIYLLTFLKEKFGLCRTTVYNYLEVVDEFATYIEEEGKEPEYRINVEAESYQFWQLIEMTSLTYQERLKVQPNWTRDEIRAYKKSLREKKTGIIQPAEQVEAEDKPITEAQQRFARYSKDDLIDYVVQLEDSVESSKLEIERILACPVTVSNVLPLKRELSTVIEKQLKSYNYEIHLHGRKQGVKAFAGVLARVILESCNSDSDSHSSAVSHDVEPIQEKLAV